MIKKRFSKRRWTVGRESRHLLTRLQAWEGEILRTGRKTKMGERGLPKTVKRWPKRPSYVALLLENVKVIGFKKKARFGGKRRRGTENLSKRKSSRNKFVHVPMVHPEGGGELKTHGQEGWEPPGVFVGGQLMSRKWGQGIREGLHPQNVRVVRSHQTYLSKEERL